MTMRLTNLNIQWREKFRAALIHSMFTAASAACAAALIFLVWYPGDFSSMSGGKELFALITGCELLLGPLISLVIYNSRKPKGELIRDYLIVGCVQLAALFYGVYTTSQARPVFVAFTVDRLELVAAADIDLGDLQLAPAEFQTLSWSGPVYVEAELPEDPEEQTEVLFAALGGGKDVHVRPKYYRPYDADRVLNKALPLGSLIEKTKDLNPTISDELIALNRKRPDLVWIPIQSYFSTWTAVLDPATALPVSLVPVNPFDLNIPLVDG